MTSVKNFASIFNECKNGKAFRKITFKNPTATNKIWQISIKIVQNLASIGICYTTNNYAEFGTDLPF